MSDLKYVIWHQGGPICQGHDRISTRFAAVHEFDYGTSRRIFNGPMSACGRSWHSSALLKYFYKPRQLVVVASVCLAGGGALRGIFCCAVKQMLFYAAFFSRAETGVLISRSNFFHADGRAWRRTWRTIPVGAKANIVEWA
jgi:hypothetical protein